jgi:hypothetical protein
MQNSTYYNLKLVEGTDTVNPLTVDVPNYETIDEQMHNNSVAGVGFATELANGSNHAITRENSECPVFRFIASAEWKLGDSVSVDGVPVSALLPSGETLPTGAYVINANVLCILTGTNLTIFADRKKVDNANEIAYNDTTVETELNKLNNNLSKVVGTITLPASSWTNVNVYLYKRDGVAHVRFFGITTASITANTIALTVGIPPKTSVTQIPTLMNSAGAITGTILTLNTNGTVVFSVSLAAGVYVSFDFEYECYL